MPPAIEVRGLTRRFGRFVAVDNLSFQVEQGEIFGFLGANGAGKSTTIRMLCGLLRPSAGTAMVGGVDVGRDPEAVKRRIGYMSQRFSLYEALTVDQNIRFFGGVYGLSGERLEERRRFVIEMAGLKGREIRSPPDNRLLTSRRRCDHRPLVFCRPSLMRAGNRLGVLARSDLTQSPR